MQCLSTKQSCRKWFNMFLLLKTCWGHALLPSSQGAWDTHLWFVQIKNLQARISTLAWQTLPFSFHWVFPWHIYIYQHMYVSNSFGVILPRKAALASLALSTQGRDGWWLTWSLLLKVEKCPSFSHFPFFFSPLHLSMAFFATTADNLVEEQSWGNSSSKRPV